MSDADQSVIPAGSVRSLQILLTCMVAGALVFLIVTFILPGRPLRPPVEGDQRPLLSYIALFYGIFAIFAGKLIPGLVTSASLRRLACVPQLPHASDGSEDAAAALASGGIRLGLTGIFTARTIIGAAIDEGAALFLCVAFLIEGLPACAALAGILILALLLRMPSQSRADQWLDEQLRQLGEERPGGERAES